MCQNSDSEMLCKVGAINLGAFVVVMVDCEVDPANLVPKLRPLSIGGGGHKRICTAPGYNFERVEATKGAKNMPKVVIDSGGGGGRGRRLPVNTSIFDPCIRKLQLRKNGSTASQ